MAILPTFFTFLLEIIPENGVTVKAVRQLTQKYWVYDGSLNRAYLEIAGLESANIYRENLGDADLR
jgi:hypothetical protein